MLNHSQRERNASLSTNKYLYRGIVTLSATEDLHKKRKDFPPMREATYLHDMPIGSWDSWMVVNSQALSIVAVHIGRKKSHSEAHRKCVPRPSRQAYKNSTRGEAFSCGWNSLGWTGGVTTCLIRPDGPRGQCLNEHDVTVVEMYWMPLFL